MAWIQLVYVCKKGDIFITSRRLLLTRLGPGPKYYLGHIAEGGMRLLLYSDPVVAVVSIPLNVIWTQCATSCNCMAVKVPVTQYTRVL